MVFTNITSGPIYGGRSQDEDKKEVAPTSIAVNATDLVAINAAITVKKQVTLPLTFTSGTKAV